MKDEGKIARRRAERKISDLWVEVKFEDLKKGNVFRLLEPSDGCLVKDASGESEFVAASDAYLEDLATGNHGIWSILLFA